MSNVEIRRPLVALPSTASLRRAADAMVEHSVGTVVIVDGAGHPEGMLTDRDLCVRAVAFDRDPDSSTVAGAMTTEVHTAPKDAPHDDVLGEMRALGVRRMVLVDSDGRAVGVTSIDDELDWIAARFGELYGRG